MSGGGRGVASSSTRARALISGRARPTLIAGAAGVLGSLAMWIATLAYDGDANIRIDIFINGVIIAFVLLVVVAACGIRLLEEGRGARSDDVFAKVCDVVLAAVLIFFALLLVGQMLDPGIPIGAKALNILAAAACAVSGIRLIMARG